MTWAFAERFHTDLTRPSGGTKHGKPTVSGTGHGALSASETKQGKLAALGQCCDSVVKNVECFKGPPVCASQSRCECGGPSRYLACGAGANCVQWPRYTRQSGPRIIEAATAHHTIDAIGADDEVEVVGGVGAEQHGPCLRVDRDRCESCVDASGVDRGEKEFM